MTVSGKPRMVWFDANRVCAAMGVVLIHSTTDFAGSVFPKAAIDERIIPVFLRSIGEFSGSEMFFFFSLFLMASRLDRRPASYGSALADQARRLLVPFVFWVVFYAFFRLMKAGAFGYQPHIWEELSHWQNWLGYFVLGNVQYHLHFLPTLFFIFMFFPVMRLATRYPILGLAVFPTLAVMNYVQSYFWQLDIDPLLREFMLRAVKVFGYVGYGFAAFSIFGIWKDGIPRGESKLIRKAALFFAAIAYLAIIPFFGAALTSGTWGAREGWSFFGHLLMPVFMFALFMGGQHEHWSPRWSRFAKYTFGIYLVHPLVIDLFDVLMVSSGPAMAPWLLVIVRYFVVLPVSALLAIGLSRLTATAWTIGLGPAPWEWGRKSAALVEV